MPETARAVLDLSDPRASDPEVAGAKAANLAQAAGAGLPVLPGVVLTTGAPPQTSELDGAWERLTANGTRPLVVRSSSTVEDAGESSMAGQFKSVLGVRTLSAFRDAIAVVLDSATRRAAAGASPAPMAVLIQPELDAAIGGVLFGVEPVSGDRHRLMVEAVPGSPNELVSGTVTAARYVLRRHGHVLEVAAEPVLTHRQLRQLARLARRAELVFGRPQDVEWAYDRNGDLWLLQSRPVTATGHGDAGTGPVLGPGPVGETFPHPLRPLEQDLWLAPLRAGICDALRLTAGVSARRLNQSPVVAVFGGRIAVDLELLGAASTHRPLVRALDPRRPARRLLAAWRVGRLRAQMASLAGSTIHGADRRLKSLPALASLSDADLIRLLPALTTELTRLHAHEIVAGMLLPAAGADEPTGASLALRALARGRADGFDDASIVGRTPVVLSLVPPRIREALALPAAPAVLPAAHALGDLAWREALRLRARWVQEAGARAASELGERLTNNRRLADADTVAFLKLDELFDIIDGAAAPPAAELEARARACAGPPLPAMFRVNDAHEVVVVASSHHGREGRPAGGGRGAGIVGHDAPAGPGAVLVVESLSPELASSLPGLAGLVSETGSTLSHLAILAREFGVPTVVAVPDARRRFPVGTRVLVDGNTGEVSIVTSPEEKEVSR